MLIAMLLAATLQFGTVKRPVVVIDVDHPKLQEVALSATSGMKKTRVGNADVYVRVPPNADNENATIDVVVATGGHFRAVHVPFYGNCAPRPPRVSLATDDPNVPIIRVEVNSPQYLVEVNQTVLLDLRGEPMATSVGAEDFEGHGKCGSPDADYAVKTAMTCQWSAARRDFVCRQARVQIRDWNTRLAWRAFLLLRDEPIVRARDVKKPDELLTSSERTVAGEGVVESIPIADGLELFVIPSTGELFELHGWLVDRCTQRVIAVTTTPLDSEAVPEPRRNHDDNDQPWTPDDQHLDVQRLASIHDRSLTVVPFTAKDGVATGLFWLGYDGTHASLLRVATDAHEYLDCNVLVRPSSAVSQTIVTSPFAAKLRVEGPAPQWSDLVEVGIGETPCSYDARVTWKNGFVIERSGKKKCAANARRNLTVHADGRVTATSLSPTP